MRRPAERRELSQPLDIALPEFVRERLAERLRSLRAADAAVLDCHVDFDTIAAEVEAKLTVVMAYERTQQANDEGGAPGAGYADGLRESVRLLALPYADHPRFRPAWASSTPVGQKRPASPDWHDEYMSNSDGPWSVSDGEWKGSIVWPDRHRSAPLGQHGWRDNEESQ